MSKKAEIKYCWEFSDCPEEMRDNCVAYTTKTGDSCWFLMGTKGCLEGRNCIDCEWY